jgi:hypothetical protein
MTDKIERPVFYEGQILGADDLTATVDAAGGRLTRHERYLHLWGIAYGLELSGKDKQTAKGAAYKEVTLSAGMAVDGTGREIIVPADELLSEDRFDQSNIAIQDDTAWYPVMLVGRDEPAPSTFTSGSCGSSQPARLIEGYDISFGRPGDELELDTQTQPQVGDGPGNGSWYILVGYVQWNGTNKLFTGFSKQPPKMIQPRYAGVAADTVAARGGTLTLRTERESQSGKPAVSVDESDGGRLQFGLLTDQGEITPLLTVDSKGNLTVVGKISGALATGGVQVESGIATDGMILPLPSGVSDKQVADGSATVHVQISPLIKPEYAPNTSAKWGPFPLEAYVDPDRRVHCTVRWLEFGAAFTFKDVPAACQYLVVAAVHS